MDYTVGERVFWLRTLGGGGGSGHRPNPKEATPATVTKLGTRAVQIQPDDNARSGPTWVSPESITRVVAHVGREIAEAFGMANLPNTIVHDDTTTIEQADAYLRANGIVHDSPATLDTSYAAQVNATMRELSETDELGALLGNFENAAFECGEWTKADADEPYEAVAQRAAEARAALRAFVERKRGR